MNEGAGPGSRRARSGAVAYGVDVGGTKILGVAIGPAGDVLAERRVGTPHQAATTSARGLREPDGTGATVGDAHPGEAIADAIASLLEQLHLDVVRACGDTAGKTGVEGTGIEGTGIEGTGIEDVDPLGASPIGIGVAGLVDTEGVLRFSPNLAAASGADIGALVTARLGDEHAGDPLRAQNDANCAALAELVLGAAQGMRYGLVVTLGTGIGGALVADGVVCTGPRGFAGEVGHMVVDPNGPPCPCGHRGCWERFASGAGLARLAREAALAGTLHEAVRLAGGDPELVTGEHVTAAAAAGDAEALRVVEELGWWVGLGLANLVALVDPEMVVVGGGLGHAGEMLLEPTRRALASLVEGGSARGVVPVVETALGERAGAVGAALAARTGLLDPAAGPVVPSAT